jgi:RHS repeat-associated protein
LFSEIITSNLSKIIIKFTIRAAALAVISLLAFSTVQAAQMKQAFPYDAAGRLISVTTDGDTAQASLDERYVYDKSGNITEKVVNGQTVRMTYDAANQLMSRTDADRTVNFVYDSAGRLVSEHTGGQVIAQYEYGYLDKVIQVTRGDQVTQFHYNARGMLVAKERDGQIIETFGWDGIGLLAKNETVYASEAHISGGVPLAAIDAGSESAVMQYFDSDYLGTTTAVYSASGEVYTHLASSFGAGTESGELRFTGKPYDADLDAHVFPFRNYKAEAGNWASADPAGFPDGSNQHYYAAVPTMRLDPLGLWRDGDDYVIPYYRPVPAGLGFHTDQGDRILAAVAPFAFGVAGFDLSERAVAHLIGGSLQTIGNISLNAGEQTAFENHDAFQNVSDFVLSELTNASGSSVNFGQKSVSFTFGGVNDMALAIHALTVNFSGTITPTPIVSDEYS